MSTVPHWSQNFHRRDFDLQNKVGRGRPSVDEDDQLKKIHYVVNDD